MSKEDARQAKAEAAKKIKLEQQGKQKPSPKTYIVLLPILVAIIYFLLNRTFIDSLITAIVIVLFWLAVDEIVYRYRMQKEK